MNATFGMSAQVLGGPGRRLLLGRAADLADQHDRLGLGVRREQLQDVEECRPDDRVAADADARRLPDAGVGHRLDRLVGQRAGARDDADAALAVDGAGDDPDLGAARRRRAGAVRPDQAWRRRAWTASTTAIMSSAGMPSVMQKIVAMPAAGGLEDRVRRAAGRDEDAGGVRAGLADRLGHRVEHRHACRRAPAGRPCPASRRRRSGCRRPASPGCGTRPRGR